MALTRERIGKVVANQEVRLYLLGRVHETRRAGPGGWRWPDGTQRLPDGLEARLNGFHVERPAA